MNELLAAAKAVIDCWDDPQNISAMPIENLRAAVERAESQKATGFDDWWRKQDMYHCSKSFATTIWTAAQQAERERLRQKVAEIIRLEDFDDVMDVFRD